MPGDLYEDGPFNINVIRVLVTRLVFGVLSRNVMKMKRLF